MSPTSARRRYLRSLSIGACLLTATAVLAGVAPASAAPPAPTREQIYAQLGVDQVPADYVILVDTSGSMVTDNRYANVRTVLGQFLSGLSPSDYVAAYTFDSYTQVRYVGQATNPGAIVNRLPTGPNPHGATDIGAALEQALNELDRPGASPIATVVLLTDGKQAAPAGSKYLATDSPAWTELKTRAAALHKTWLGAYALPLGTDTGAGLLRAVIPDATVLDPTSVQGLGAYLDRSKAATRLAKARTALAADIGRGVAAAWSPPTVDGTRRSANLNITLRSQFAHAPVTVTNLGLVADPGIRLTGSLPATLTLQPGQSQVYSVHVSWAPSSPLWPHSVTRSVGLRLTGSVTSSWTASLAPDIALNVATKPVNDADAVSLTARVGSWAPVSVGTGSVVLLVLVLWLLYYVRANPRLPGGTMQIYGLRGHDGVEMALLAELAIRGRSVTYSGSQLDGSLRIRGRRIPMSTFGVRHTGLDATLTRTDGRRSAHVIRPGGGGLIGGLWFLHVPPGTPSPSYTGTSVSAEATSIG